jgi:hypothetical protein
MNVLVVMVEAELEPAPVAAPAACAHCCTVEEQDMSYQCVLAAAVAELVLSGGLVSGCWCMLVEFAVVFAVAWRGADRRLQAAQLWVGAVALVTASAAQETSLLPVYPPPARQPAKVGAAELASQSVLVRHGPVHSDLERSDVRELALTVIVVGLEAVPLLVPLKAEIRSGQSAFGVWIRLPPQPCLVDRLLAAKPDPFR